MKAACSGCYKSLKVFLSARRPGRNKRAMTPFSAKTTVVGKAERWRFSLLCCHPELLKRSQIKPLTLDFPEEGGEIAVRPLELRVRRYFSSGALLFRLPASPAHSEQVPLRAAVFVHPAEPHSTESSPLRKGARSAPDFCPKRRRVGRLAAPKDGSWSLFVSKSPRNRLDPGRSHAAGLIYRPKRAAPFRTRGFPQASTSENGGGDTLPEVSPTDTTLLIDCLIKK